MNTKPKPHEPQTRSAKNDSRHAIAASTQGTALRAINEPVLRINSSIPFPEQEVCSCVAVHSDERCISQRKISRVLHRMKLCGEVSSMEGRRQRDGQDDVVEQRHRTFQPHYTTVEYFRTYATGASGVEESFNSSGALLCFLYFSMQFETFMK
ncbi:hypothetical protein [Paraburkholderia guartelaensis]|uniref:hypothetical protein n=1 Tax=Paraburkholderia guartelaensis TaxID=2546446 RepID=UPI00140A3484|nr:hypothetical protein [Paraburkholderia guartelaensis]